MDLQLLPMNDTHIEQISELERLCFTSPWSEEAIKSELLNPHSIFMVAEYLGQVGGYISMHNILGEGYIANVAVAPHLRKNGVGTYLLDSLISYAKKNAMLLLTLEVRASNYNAIDLYTKKGFEIVGERKNFYIRPIENALIMTNYLMENLI